MMGCLNTRRRILKAIDLQDKAHSWSRVCNRAVNTSNSGSGGPGFKSRPSRSSLHSVSLRPGV